eukprot:NODE_2195_length_747_cov_84.852436_g1769_i0.p2 GENE.NODE_2195_length_747_cov_84.852436_g1769_i0~~NODE_2195_length_747_cov_84.852436_g1769_i0.p2  ORF type:complete len:81 (-),score=4.89 NODE_2195_length_747_cov_84.852436_g1769_i0:354-596(-)
MGSMNEYIWCVSCIYGVCGAHMVCVVYMWCASCNHGPSLYDEPPFFGSNVGDLTFSTAASLRARPANLPFSFCSCYNCTQ